MDDIQQRDLSRIPDDRLTAAQRRELQRRMRVFLQAVSRARGDIEPRST